MNEEMSDNEKKYRAGMELFLDAAQEMGMSQEEILAEVRRHYTRMENLTEEGFTIDQADQIILKEDQKL